ncbi:MAG: DUF3899 domain-containing protein [Lachnospiraceae bacterium]|nr:DUF3899 domain-containing protein [Lachnospiraceae bacterium]
MRKSKRFWISFVICSVCTFLTAWARGVFEQTAPVYVFQVLSDSFLVVGMVATCIALLLFTGNEGTFDMIVYGVQTFWSVFRKDMSRKYETFYDYRVARQEKKSPFLFLLVCGGVFLLMSGAMYAVYRML